MRFIIVGPVLILALFAGVAIENIGVVSRADTADCREASHSFDRYAHNWIDDGRYSRQHNLALRVF